MNTSRNGQTWRYIIQLIRQMSQEVQSHHVWQRLDHEERDGLKKCVMLPIRSPQSNRDFDRLVAATDSGEWFIADRKILHTGLEEKVPLLALPIEDAKECGQFLALLGLGNRWLSGISVARPRNKVVENGANATRLMERAHFIDR